MGISKAAVIGVPVVTGRRKLDVRDWFCLFDRCKRRKIFDEFKRTVGGNYY